MADRKAGGSRNIRESGQTAESHIDEVSESQIETDVTENSGGEDISCTETMMERLNINDTVRSEASNDDSSGDAAGGIMNDQISEGDVQSGNNNYPVSSEHEIIPSHPVSPETNMKFASSSTATEIVFNRSSDICSSLENNVTNLTSAKPTDRSQEENEAVPENNVRTTDSDGRIRDSSSSSGSREAVDAYSRFFEEYFPDYREAIYKVPRVFFDKKPFSAKTRGDIQQSLGETTSVFLHNKAESSIAGDNAEKRVVDFIERKLRREFQENKWPAFIIMSYQFENFCNISNVLLVQDENKHVQDKPIDGEHDLVIVHYKHGIIFIQVKSAQTETNLNKYVKRAIEQIDEDKEFFKTNFKDFKLDNCITSVVALPNIDRQDLEDHKDCKSRLIEFGLSQCIFNIELTDRNAGDEWWSNITKERTGFKSHADYKQVLAKYIGDKSTVQIASKNQTPFDGRRFSECVSAMGIKYMNIILTPEQIYILYYHLPRLVIHGQFGTGKTVLLILKVRRLLRRREKVCVITVCTSPLEQVLRTSIKHELNQAECEGLSTKKARDQEELSLILKDCAKQDRHVFIDEFPSFTRTNHSLQETIKHYPKDLIFWCIMSRERENTLSRIQNEFFEPKLHTGQNQATGNSSDTVVYTRIQSTRDGRNSGDSSVHDGSQNQGQESEGFIHLRLSKILRCPPTVHSILPSTTFKKEKSIACYNEKTITKPGTMKKLASHFHSLGLTSTKINDVSTEPQIATTLKWKDVVVVDEMKRSLQSTLKKLKVPLASCSWQDKTLKAQYRTSRTGLDSFTHVACLQNKCCVYVKGGDLTECNNAETDAAASPGDDGKVKQLNKSELATLLFEHSFYNATIEKELKKKSTDIARDWSEILFLEEPKSLIVLRDLDIPIVTPTEETYVNKVLYTTKQDFKGFRRDEVLIFKDDEVLANPSEDISYKGPNIQHIEDISHDSHEGPKIQRIDHTGHAETIQECDRCKSNLQKIVQDLGLMNYGGTRANAASGGGHLHPSVPSEPRASVQPISESENILAPRRDLTVADVLIVDVRQNPVSIAGLFQDCGLAVVDKLSAESLEMDEMLLSKSVMYVTPRMVTGLEKKVVFVVKADNEELISYSRAKIIEDPLLLGCTRYTSQLVIITAN